MKLKLGKGSKILLKWNVRPVDYSKEKEDEIASKIAKKYGIKKEKVRVDPVYIHTLNDDSIDIMGNGTINDARNPEFQQKLYREYIKEYDIKDIDFDKIIEIDNIINNLIDYDTYSTSNKYTIRWVKWSNFMSYGKDNYFNFDNIDGLVLLSSDPANQGGKTTFCIDLIRFLLFGKVTSREDDWVLSNAFNRYLPEETECSVEGCININGEDFVIRRVLTRPALSKRTERSKITQKVYYYKLVNDEYVELEDEENLSDSTTTKSNKKIKECIGNEKDFDLMICVDSDNLKDLIKLKNTERGRLISRWIGLLPLEEKDKIARDYFNSNIVKTLFSTKYNKDDCFSKKEEFETSNKDLETENKKIDDKIKALKNELDVHKQTLETILTSKPKIDKELEGIDISTVQNKLEEILNKGKKSAELLNIEKELLKTYDDISADKLVDFSDLENEVNDMRVAIGIARNELVYIKKNIEDLKNSEFCPTCGAKLKNVDNTSKIQELNERYDQIVNEGKVQAEILKQKEAELEKFKKMKERCNQKAELSLIIDKIEVDIENYRSKYRETKRLLDDIQENMNSIQLMNKYNTSLNNINVTINNVENMIHHLNDEKSNNISQIKYNDKNITDLKKILDIIEEETILLRHWKLYLEMVGKNGISKMVLRSVLPFINNELKRLLSDVCDFDVDISINDKNEVMFNYIHNDIVSNLGSGSGFEKTVASLALRSVLSKVSNFNKPSFVVFDEILGGCADYNYDKLKELYNKIIKDYKQILHITHLKQIADWHKHQIVIKKEDDISYITMG